MGMMLPLLFAPYHKNLAASQMNKSSCTLVDRANSSYSLQPIRTTIESLVGLH